MIKRNYVFSDIHDDIEALAAFTDYAQSQEADNLIFLGDFSLRPYTASDLSNLIDSPQNPRDIQKFIKAKRTHNEKIIGEMKTVLDSSGIDYLVIPGNYDPKISKIFGENDIHNKTTKIGEAKVFGYGGADIFPPQILPLANWGEIVKFDHRELYDRLITEKPDIAITHNPPRGLCDDMFDGTNIGATSTAEYIEENYPKLVLSGHIHEAGPLGNNPARVKGIRTVENDSGKKTTIINPGNLGRFELISIPSLETKMSFPFGTFVEVLTEEDGTPKKINQYSLAGIKGKEGIGKVSKISEFDLNYSLCDPLL
jgi:Icc-related predicted phosphoesterase